MIRRTWERLGPLGRAYLAFTAGLVLLVIVLGMLERAGLARHWVANLLLVATLAAYAAIGIRCRTADAAEFYVAGRRVPPVMNGMATAADWMSAASFIGMAGTLYLTGFNGLAYIMGWTGGFVLVALLLAPHLRRMGGFTLPDFLGARYGGHGPRLIGAAIGILCSLTYLVAQISGVALITTRLTGVGFELGIFLGLGGMLLCSFLGGMKAITWTQVAQYVVLIIAYLVPVAWLSARHAGVPLPPVAYGSTLSRLEARERELLADPREREVRALIEQRVSAIRDRIARLPQSLEDERGRLTLEHEALTRSNAPREQVRAVERALRALPRDPQAARAAWTRELEVASREAAPVAQTEAFAGSPAESDAARRNFLALVACLMLGTASLPHVLTRFYTTPTVRAARTSVAWSLFFILLLYVSAPALAVLVKMELLSTLVGTAHANLPGWVASWSRVDPGLVNVTDLNGDGVVQFAEIALGGDAVVLAMPEIAGLPYVLSGLIAAGALAAALSTADGLLLTIAAAFSHDAYYRVIDPGAPSTRRVTLSKVLVLVVALVAAYVAAQRPADILFLVSAAFSLAASGLFPVLVLGIFWKRANAAGAVAGMLAGLGVAIYYMAITQPWLRQLFGVSRPLAECMWWEVAPVAAGIFGVPAGFAAIVVISLCTAPPGAQSDALVDHLRSPEGAWNAGEADAVVK